jgi:hypothetical protein
MMGKESDEPEVGIMADQMIAPQSMYAEKMNAVLADPLLSEAERRRHSAAILADAHSERDQLMVQLAFDERRKAAFESLLPWTKITEYQLERNDCSRLHKLADAARAGDLLCLDEKDQRSVAKSNDLLFDKAQVFIVMHDWAAAFGDAIGALEDEFVLPYPHCAFEFRISGKTVIAITLQPEDGKATAAWFMDVGQGRWVFVHSTNDSDQFGTVAAFGFAWTQIKSICVALDAEVAAHEVIRAPVALNKKIEKAGRTPVFDHRVVSLAKRYRAAADNSNPSGLRRRLHFRRGHWRHYEGRKTWINWMLVGDPSLGFIDKHYSL